MTCASAAVPATTWPTPSSGAVALQTFTPPADPGPGGVLFSASGEVLALTGYSFLFSTERDLNKSHEKDGGLTPPPLTLSAEGGSAMQLAAPAPAAEAPLRWAGSPETSDCFSALISEAMLAFLRGE